MDVARKTSTNIFIGGKRVKNPLKYTGQSNTIWLKSRYDGPKTRANFQSNSLSSHRHHGVAYKTLTGRRRRRRCSGEWNNSPHSSNSRGKQVIRKEMHHALR